MSDHENYIISPKVKIRETGNDIDTINEAENRVVVMDNSSRIVSNALLRDESGNQIATSIRWDCIVEGGIDIRLAIESVQNTLVDAGKIVPERAFDVPRIVVRDLETVLNDADLQELRCLSMSKKHTSQYSTNSDHSSERHCLESEYS